MGAFEELWQDWETTERDVGTGFEEVYPPFKERHVAHRVRYAVRPLEFDISYTGASIGWTDAGLTGKIWIPPWASFLMFTSQLKNNGTLFDVFQIRFKIGSYYTSGLGNGASIGTWWIDWGYWPVFTYPPTDISAILDTEQDVKLEYRMIGASGTYYARDIDGIDTGKSKSSWWAWRNSVNPVSLPSGYPHLL